MIPLIERHYIRGYNAKRWLEHLCNWLDSEMQAAGIVGRCKMGYVTTKNRAIVEADVKPPTRAARQALFDAMTAYPVVSCLVMDYPTATFSVSCNFTVPDYLDTEWERLLEGVNL